MFQVLSACYTLTWLWPGGGQREHNSVAISRTPSVLKTTFLLWQSNSRQGTTWLAHNAGLSLYHRFPASPLVISTAWLIVKINVQLSLKGLVYVLRENFLLWAASLEKMTWDWPTPSCLSKCVKDLWKLTADQLGPDFFRVSLDVLSSYCYRNPQTQKEIIAMLLNSKI